MIDFLAEAINHNDGDRAAKIIQDALGIEGDDVAKPVRYIVEAARSTQIQGLPFSSLSRDMERKRRIKCLAKAKATSCKI